MVRNKSVIGKDIRAINAEDGQNRLMLKNNHSFVAPKIGGTVDQNVCSQSERNSFTRMMKGKERYHNVQNKPEHRYSPNLKEINEHYG